MTGLVHKGDVWKSKITGCVFTVTWIHKRKDGSELYTSNVVWQGKNQEFMFEDTDLVNMEKVSGVDWL